MWRCIRLLTATPGRPRGSVPQPRQHALDRSAGLACRSVRTASHRPRVRQMSLNSHDVAAGRPLPSPCAGGSSIIHGGPRTSRRPRGIGCQSGVEVGAPGRSVESTRSRPGDLGLEIRTVVVGTKGLASTRVLSLRMNLFRGLGEMPTIPELQSAPDVQVLTPLPLRLPCSRRPPCLGRSPRTHLT
jgi:hypothetical protein